MNTPAPEMKRVEATRRERRFRAETGELADLKLAVPENLKKPSHTYRWVNDKANERVQALHAKDWEVVKNSAIAGTGEGEPVSRVVGTSENGQPLRAMLMEKPLDWHEEDQARKNKSRLAIEAQIDRGIVPSSGLDPAEAKTYVPQGHRNAVGGRRS